VCFFFFFFIVVIVAVVVFFADWEGRPEGRAGKGRGVCYNPILVTVLHCTKKAAPFIATYRSSIPNYGSYAVDDAEFSADMSVFFFKTKRCTRAKVTNVTPWLLAGSQPGGTKDFVHALQGKKRHKGNQSIQFNSHIVQTFHIPHSKQKKKMKPHR
jgi:hypothetical protein